MTDKKYRSDWAVIQIRVPMQLELKAEAEVRGCSVGKVIELHMDGFRHLMMAERELIEHLKKDHPEQVHDYEPYSPEDLARMEKEHEEQRVYQEKYNAVLDRLRKGLLAHKFIAQRKAIETKMKKAGVAK